MGLISVSYWENLGVGVTFDNNSIYDITDKNYTYWSGLEFLIIDFVVYTFLLIYLDNIVTKYQICCCIPKRLRKKCRLDLYLTKYYNRNNNDVSPRSRRRLPQNVDDRRPNEEREKRRPENNVQTDSIYSVPD
eukprot:UN31972